MVNPINNQNPLFTDSQTDLPKIYSSRPQENVSEEDKKAFDAKMQALLDLLAQNPPDSLKIQATLIELKGMTKDSAMDQAVNDIIEILAAAYQTFTDKDDFKETLYFPPASLQVALDLGTGQIDPQTQKPLTIRDAITSVATAAIKDPNATKSVGDLALAMVQDAFHSYETRLKDLQDQINISKEIMNDLTDIQNILNLVDINSPASFKWNPTSWDQIPPDLQKILAKPPYNMTSMSNFNQSKFVDAACEYFTQEIGWKANPGDIAAAYNKVIAARDSLKVQLDGLAAAGADKTDEHGAYQTVKAVYDSLVKSFPLDKFPAGSTVVMEKQIIGYEKTDFGTMKIEDKNKPIYADVPVVYVNGKPTKTDSKTITNALAQFIGSGQAKSPDGISELVSNAVTANQNLSSKMADDMKALNTWFQQIMDVLTAIADAYNKGTTSFARNARG